MPLTLTMTTEEKVRVEAYPVTEAGAPATLDGPVLYEVTAGDCTIEAIDDISCYVVSGAVGTSTVTATADADLGSGIVTLEDLMTVQVVAPMAEQLGLAAAAPELKGS